MIKTRGWNYAAAVQLQAAKCNNEPDKMQRVRKRGRGNETKERRRKEAGNEANDFSVEKEETHNHYYK